MASMSHATGTLSVALLIAFSTAGPAIAQAQHSQMPPETPRPAQTPTLAEMDTITVVAPRINYQVRRVPGSAIPAAVTIAENRAEVDITDLDLTRTADLYKLEERVNVAAAQVCGELAEQLPEGQPSLPVCKQRAVEDAMAQVQQVTRLMAGD